MKKTKALILFSGGLDSMLAAKLLKEQEIEITGICFTSNFFSAQKAEIAAREISITLKKVDISQEILRLVKNPPNGYGQHLNPCLDCHTLMIKQASAIMKEEDYDFIATGEVLGQRPFSQNKAALEKIVKLANAQILRPLSAKLLPETEIEQNGLVNRRKLLNLKGRRREAQLALAKKYNLNKIPSPAGGCLLTDPDFSERLIKMLDFWPDCDINDVELLKHGRPFWINLKSGANATKAVIVVGRYHEDNLNLKKLAQKDDVLAELKNVMGPTSLLRIKEAKMNISLSNIKVNIPQKIGEINLIAARDEQAAIQILSILTGFYAPKVRGQIVEVIIKQVN